MANYSSPNRPWHLIVAAVLSVLVIVGFYIAGALHFRLNEWASFGDFVAGAAGVILTSMSFLALLYTIHIQSTELSLSRQELALTREEMSLNREEVAKSAEALSEQVRAVALQNFERTLFESLGFLSAMVEQFEYKSPIEDKPRHVIQSFFSMYHGLGHHNINLGGMGEEDGDELEMHPPLNDFLDQLRLMLAPYFRTLFNIYRFLSESNYVNIEYYNRIIRSQIPDHALAILFYNSLTPGGRKFQRYIIHFNIMDNMPSNLLINPNHKNILDNLPTAQALENNDDTIDQVAETVI